LLLFKNTFSKNIHVIIYLPSTVAQEPEKGTTHRTANIKLRQNHASLNHCLESCSQDVFRS